MSHRIPWVESNRDDVRLIENVHPPVWTPPMPASKYHVVVVGAGTAGLITSIAAAGLGARVALIEADRMGGDCLNVGCVPSKLLISAARALRAARRGLRDGMMHGSDPVADFPAIMNRMRNVRGNISVHDSAARYKQQGVDVFFGRGEFVNGNTCVVNGTPLNFRRAVICTGARAAVPNVSGLAEVGFLTNETVFNLTELPRRMVVLGGGPIGCELAQTFAAFGSHVTVIQKEPRILPRDSAAASEVVANAFRAEGITVISNALTSKVESAGSGKRVIYSVVGEPEASVECDEILVATGRAPNVAGLGLERLGIEFDVRNGVKVDASLRTSSPCIYAAGDVCSAFRFTHAADVMARVVVQNVLSLGSSKFDPKRIPWSTYTSPEVAGVGLTPAAAEKQGIPFREYTESFSRVDRAILDGETDGFVSILTGKKNDRILGATIVHPHAGELIGEVTMAMTHGIGLSKLSRSIRPYPTSSEVFKRVADSCSRERLKPWVKQLLGMWLRWLA